MITLTQETMSVSDWINVKDCPIQRNTELHAKKSLKKHLKQSSETHKRVSAARLPNKDIYKLDGHTRSYLWAEGKLIPPIEDLTVDVYLVEKIEEVIDLYKQFDSPHATESTVDRLNGAYRLNNFFPESELIKKGPITSSIKIIIHNNHSHSIDIYKEVSQFIPALKPIDSEGFSKKGFTAPVLAALVITFMRDGEPSLEFWRKYSKDQGEKTGKGKDGVQALKEMLLDYRVKGKNSQSMFGREILGKTISCYINYKNNRLYTSNTVKTTNIEDYIFSANIKINSKEDPTSITISSNKLGSTDKHVNEKIDKTIMLIRSGFIKPCKGEIMRMMDISYDLAETILHSLDSQNIIHSVPGKQDYELS